MHPVLIRILGFNIYSYGFFLFISFLIGIKLVETRAQRFGVSSETVNNLALIVLGSVIVGARLLYVVLHWDEFKNDLIGIIAFWRGGLGGLMFFGGFILALLSGIFYLRVKKLPLAKMLDAVTPAIVLGEGFTRIGCFLNGCCFGRPTNLPWGVEFPQHSPAGEVFCEKIHPTQLYSSLAGFILFGLALVLERKKLKPGALFGIILSLYALFRFLIDFIRYYENLENFIVNQIIAGSLFIIGIIYAIQVSKKTHS
ncbi:MAG: prolipoprotein diacylglyceryl transferase [candidate division WOR-3 bacterium]|nr:prolipoprotein diacylglyceryl transferase [candidate division WOR-3 bacterium]MCX7757964.1 prolipoprotein diacylglyceryl transferase [candidate division WOR-3 bacterium]MDW7987230.1 prolipoprotein diacylglyceryl transferase [candidate division WOR-3 bacterium]